MRLEKIKIWEGVIQSEESNNERLLLKILGERARVNNQLKDLHTVRIPSHGFGCLRAKI